MLRKIVSLAVIFCFTPLQFLTPSVSGNTSIECKQQFGRTENCEPKKFVTGFTFSNVSFAFAGSNLRTEQPTIKGVTQELIGEFPERPTDIGKGVGPAMGMGSEPNRVSNTIADLNRALEDGVVHVVSDSYRAEKVEDAIKELRKIALHSATSLQDLARIAEAIKQTQNRFETYALGYEEYLRTHREAFSPDAQRQEYDRLWKSDQRDEAERYLAEVNAAPKDSRGWYIYKTCVSALAEIEPRLITLAKSTQTSAEDFPHERPSPTASGVGPAGPETGSSGTGAAPAASAYDRLSAEQRALVDEMVDWAREVIRNLPATKGQPAGSINTKEIYEILAKLVLVEITNAYQPLQKAGIPYTVADSLPFSITDRAKRLGLLGPQTTAPAAEKITLAEKEAAFVAQDFLKAVEKWQGTVDWADSDIEGIERITVDLPAHYSEGEALLAGLKQRIGDKISVTVRIRGADANSHQYYKNLNSQLNLGFAIQPVVNIMESSTEYAGSLLKKGLPSNERYLFVIEEVDILEFQRQEETLTALARSTNAKNVKVALVRKVAQDMVQPTDATPKILKDLLFGEKQIEVITPATITGEELRNELSSALEALRKA